MQRNWNGFIQDLVFDFFMWFMSHSQKAMRSEVGLVHCQLLVIILRFAKEYNQHS